MDKLFRTVKCIENIFLCLYHAHSKEKLYVDFDTFTCQRIYESQWTLIPNWICMILNLEEKSKQVNQSIRKRVLVTLNVVQLTVCCDEDMSTYRGPIKSYADEEGMGVGV